MEKEKAYKLGVAQTQFRENYKSHKNSKRFIIPFCSFVITLLLVALFFISCFCVKTLSTDGMLSRGAVGQTIIVNKMAYSFSDPQRGDVVVFESVSQNGSEETLARRIIGLPGETVSIEDGVIWINGKRVVENYTTKLVNYSGYYIVPNGQYFVLNDNRRLANDSRDGWFVPKKSIIGEHLSGKTLSSALTSTRVFQKVSDISSSKTVFNKLVDYIGKVIR